MSIKKFSLILIITIVLTLGLSISLGSLLAAWTGPTTTPPDDNIATPINIGAVGQSRAAGLILNTNNDINGLIVQFGNVGIGVDNPGAKLDVAGSINATGITASGNVSAATPTATNHLTTKAYVDNAVAAAGGGGGATYMMGNSSQISGWAASWYCENYFSGYHLCNVEEFIGRRLDPTYSTSNVNLTLGGWVRTGKNSFANSEGADCGDYIFQTYAASGHYGTIAKWTNNGFIYQTVDCYSSNYPPLCCSD